ncbi:hypothetical protein [Pseudomonas monteilii]|uniref:hypothetical protein n=1 Tax=Pseudomonas monteilii TaxID=76759 RepID=UPI0015F8D247|nr:hypothetical protein [Pseudomonas monteilii]MBA6106044.1 hypothetical protein [Pseudomonas monteilii]MCE0877433.1 hypothetical protein [Pseudomonas monteilii]MCE0929486.1 hypothetical protein [Pseudomonas monteilii]MCE1015654.1 hypothetical protein [Pseudomonas monteilii]MCE1044536.1 hypothetical protein [Pseudomonas monteilii]
MFGSLYDPRFPIPEMTTANKYIKQLGWVGTQLLTLCWAFATIDVSASVLLAVAVACALYLACIGRGYRKAYPLIAASISGSDLVRLFAKAWPAFVAIIIVSGLAVDAFTWQQMGEFKTELMGLTALPYATWIVKKLFEA